MIAMQAVRPRASAARWTAFIALLAGIVMPGAPTGALSAAQAAPCKLDMAPLPQVQGVIARIFPDIEGRPRALLLRDGTQVALPDGPGAVFAAGMAPGGRIVVRGLAAPALHLVVAQAIDGACAGPRPMVAAQPSLPLVATGVVAGILFDANARPAGAWLRDGAVVWLHGGEGAWPAGMPEPPAIGRSFYATGPGIATPAGVVLDAAAYGPDAGHLRAIDPAALAAGPAPGSADYDTIMPASSPR